MTIIDEIKEANMDLEQFMKLKEVNLDTRRKELEKAKARLAELTARIDEFESRIKKLEK